MAILAADGLVAIGLMANGTQPAKFAEHGVNVAAGLADIGVMVSGFLLEKYAEDGNLSWDYAQLMRAGPSHLHH